jgi:hypothetical protein
MIELLPSLIAGTMLKAMPILAEMVAIAEGKEDAVAGWKEKRE